jgi:glutamate:Na+ symporter, ESS family
VAVADTFVALLLIGLLIVAAKAVRRRVAVLRRLFLPASVIAGTLALLAGPQVLGRAVEAVGGPGWAAGGLLPGSVLEVWTELPVLLISVVFAALFIGKRIPGLPEIWGKAAPRWRSGSRSRGVSTWSGSSSGCWSSPRSSA